MGTKDISDKIMSYKAFSMKNKTEKNPEIVFASSNAAKARRLSRLVSRGELIKIAPKIYTGNIQITESIDFSNIETAEQQLKSCNAFKLPIEGKLRLPTPNGL
ncbi:hypothetical protein MNBD_GAMMA07-374 [hydrothermal vent metagenome]|uniref:Uncharacterized protein n=1 Tax=hydrothermal vent metagenome TaxID=652676 RepID=A0A3B0X291_9ZZZZ